MARRVLAQPLLRSPPCISASRRLRSSRPGTLIEIDLESSAPTTSSSSEGEVEILGLRKLEEAMHMIFVQKSTPDWLPFVPGSSFWVPPRKRPVDVVDLVGKLANPLSEEETLSFTSGRGCWPSLEFFTQKHGGSVSPMPVELEEEGKVVKEIKTDSVDREG